MISNPKSRRMVQICKVEQHSYYLHKMTGTLMLKTRCETLLTTLKKCMTETLKKCTNGKRENVS